jgi:hypothetical protein
MGQAVHPDGMQAWIAQDYLQSISGGGVSGVNCGYIFLQGMQEFTDEF